MVLKRSKFGLNTGCTLVRHNSRRSRRRRRRCSADSPTSAADKSTLVVAPTPIIGCRIIKRLVDNDDERSAAAEIDDGCLATDLVYRFDSIFLSSDAFRNDFLFRENLRPTVILTRICVEKVYRIGKVVLCRFDTFFPQ